VSDRAVLARIAVDTGTVVDEAEVRAWLDNETSGGPGKTVDNEVARARDIGITAVPSFVVQGRFRVGGMQAPDVFIGLFDRIATASREGPEIQIGERSRGA
jgi:predicted DsbA family dithiol-disulfide isomerase